MSNMFGVAAILTLSCTLWPTLASAQASKAGVVTTLEGNVTVTRVSLPPQPLKFKDDVFIDDKITTGDRSMARMLLGGKAVVTVREHSSLKITEVPGKATIELQSGKIALAVAKEKMQPGESIELRTGNAVAGVRGTVVVAEVSRATAQVGGGGAALVTTFFVLRGQVEAIQVDPATGATVGSPVAVGTLQRFRAAGFALGQVSDIPPGEIAQIVAGLSSPLPQHTDGEEVRTNAINQGLQFASNFVAAGGVGAAVDGRAFTPPGPSGGNNNPPILPGGIGQQGFTPPTQSPPPTQSHSCNYNHGTYSSSHYHRYGSGNR